MNPNLKEMDKDSMTKGTKRIIKSNLFMVYSYIGYQHKPMHDK